MCSAGPITVSALKALFFFLGASWLLGTAICKALMRQHYPEELEKLDNSRNRTLIVPAVELGLFQTLTHSPEKTLAAFEAIYNGSLLTE
jgi:uncharacterized membrane protein (DUF4010 family)